MILEISQGREKENRTGVVTQVREEAKHMKRKVRRRWGARTLKTSVSKNEEKRVRVYRVKERSRGSTERG